MANRHDRRAAARVNKGSKPAGGPETTPSSPGPGPDPVAGALAARAFRHMAEGHLAEAEAACRELLAVAPDDAAGRIVLGTLLLESGRAAEALFHLTAQPAGADPHRHFLIAKAYLAAGQFDDAARSYGEALEHKPAYAEALAGRGAAHAALGRWAEAEADYARAVDIDPDAAEARAGLLQARAAQGC